jgi:probable F420-dependent oxidoreductase
MWCSYWSSTRHPWDELVDGCREAERLGWDGVWLPDHYMPLAEGYAGSAAASADPELGPVHEAWTALAAVAALVPRLRVGTLVTANTHHEPAVVAKMATTVDHVSGGRCVLGLGAGWQENEHQRYGIGFPLGRERLDRLDEACQVIRSLLDLSQADFEGRYYRLDGAPMEPKPLQARLPLLVGGTGSRTIDIAARHADEWNGWGTPEAVGHAVAHLEHRCESAARDPASIRRSANALVVVCDTDQEVGRTVRRPQARPTVIGTPDQLVETMAAYQAVGVDEFVAPDFHLADPGRRHELRTTLVEIVRLVGK